MLLAPAAAGWLAARVPPGPQAPAVVWALLSAPLAEAVRGQDLRVVRAEFGGRLVQLELHAPAEGLRQRAWLLWREPVAALAACG